jgi:hypothetical protein
VNDFGKYDLAHIEAADNRSGIEFEKLRFEYAWRHFDLHAKQRIQMFYFFLISVAFLCGAIVSSANSQKPEFSQLPLVAAGVGLAISFIFLALDARNRALYSISRRHLKTLEANVLYPTGFREIFENPTNRTGRVVGVMIEDESHRAGFFRHKFLIPLCHFFAAGVFLFLILHFRHLI